MQTHGIHVSLEERSYEIRIDTGMLASGRAASVIAGVAEGSRICIVTHPTLRPKYAEPLLQQLLAQGHPASLTLIPAGERIKTLSTVARLYEAFLDAKLDRKSVVVVVGGGVAGDIVGFAAATYLRGIRFIQVPTTLLAQVDSSVGGKTGVDLPRGKNLIGSFHQPSAVLIDPLTLGTLPKRELYSGLAEVIKYGIIYDEQFFEQIACELPAILARKSEALPDLIARSCEIKAEVVAQDETEQGLRAILNFGHTIGHALEAVTHYRRYKHGEAVAIGMVAEARIGERMGITSPKVTEALCALCEAAHLPVAFPSDISADAILEAGQRDKKTIGGKLRYILPTQRIGEVIVESGVPESVVRSVLSG